ncbi:MULTISPECIES: zinc-binding dehydrogenase [Sphingobium]|uniref:NADH oxidoreductase n=1 Tax=Sphingobium fuliginis (strain ATCC 27551) TaxID=336203 RepID=A0ABQ1ETL4_SPHSA|nr:MULTISPECIES: zinc-binding dehydrogenase [Sphingobium]AJR24514.1 NADH oxidase [Sphingobium sp. YBL2]RYL99550.1 NADH oxidase [Sphingobium fuliginis]WDA36625.1 zinc-binding dehydrogenase [Sphingobium sp. YC-XJ3]GFZ85443.1 NADH oxidoreductase [Sphingobium fuliginis]
MSDTHGLKLLSTLDDDGRLIVELAEETLPAPTGDQVLVRVEAAPINPSDLGLLFASADVANADYAEGRIVARMPDPARRALAGRVGQSMAIGNEGAGTVIAAGEAPEAQALLGKRVAMIGGGMYAEHRLLAASGCMVLPDDVTAEEGASAFVNPLTALGFVETMKREGHKAIVHTAAASNLGQMLVRICQEDGIPLVNIVRNEAQVAILRDLGAEYVLDSSRDDFLVQLQDAVAATGASIAFDAIGGGHLVSQILHAMEQAASKDAPYSRYGSNVLKQAYVYGALDLSPTILTRSFGFGWNVGGWLLFPFLQRTDAETAERLRQRVRDGLTTTFASHYKARISLKEALTRDAVLTYNARRTGEKYLIVPNG